MNPSLADPATRLARGKLPSAIILGGRANALSVARSLGRIGVTVYALNVPGSFVKHSRYCRWLDVRVRQGDADSAPGWSRFLLSPDAEHLRGAVLLACSDDSIELLLAHRKDLSQRYLLDQCDPPAQRAMLDKLATYQAATAAGVPTPKYWIADSPEHLASLRGELTFPLIVKPRLSHVFEGRSGNKLVIAHRFEEVAAAVHAVAATGTQCLLVEMIPGADDQLCSYFTYLDEQSRPLFAFTKRIIRRYPALSGTACYHVTDRIP
jgi:D-aspartate ligase